MIKSRKERTVWRAGKEKEEIKHDPQHCENKGKGNGMW